MSKTDGLDFKGALESAGVVAVLVGLIFVGIELRQNTASVQSASSQSLLEQSNLSNFQLAMDAEFADLYFRAGNNLDDLDDVERLRYLNYIHGEFNIWEQAFYTHQSGTLDDRLWNAYDTGYQGYLCNGSPAEVWREIGSFFGAEFRAHACSSGTD
jgi:hypothetical protein